MAFNLYRILILVSVLSTIASAAQDGGNVERKLITTLLHDYDPDIIPIRNSGKIMRVSIGLQVNSILKMDVVNQFVVIHGKIMETWSDDYLRWDPNDYDNITALAMPISKVWLPGTFLLRNLNLDDSQIRRWESVTLVMDERRPNSSYVYANYPVVLKSSCNMEVAAFSFDSQSCDLPFSSWSYTNRSLEYSVKQVHLEAFVNNQEWIVTSFKGKTETACYESAKTCASIAMFTLKTKRKPLYYTINLILPIGLISGLSLIGLASPANSRYRSERMSIGANAFLAVSGYLLVIIAEIPITSESVPLTSLYVIVNMSLLFLAACISAHGLFISSRMIDKTDNNQKKQSTKSVVLMLLSNMRAKIKGRRWLNCTREQQSHSISKVRKRWKNEKCFSVILAALMVGLNMVLFIYGTILQS